MWPALSPATTPRSARFSTCGLGSQDHPIATFGLSFQAPREGHPPNTSEHSYKPPKAHSSQAAPNVVRTYAHALLLRTRAEFLRGTAGTFRDLADHHDRTRVTL